MDSLDQLDLAPSKKQNNPVDLAPPKLLKNLDEGPSIQQLDEAPPKQSIKKADPPSKIIRPPSAQKPSKSSNKLPQMDIPSNTIQDTVPRSIKSPPKAKKSMYQMQRAIDPTRVKPQNSWKIYKKMTILININTISPSPYTILELIKEISPRAYDEMKDNLSDITMKSILTPIPFNQVIHDLKGQLDIEIRYLYTDVETGPFHLESTDNVTSIDFIDSKENIRGLKNGNYRHIANTLLASVYFSHNKLESELILSELPDIQPYFYIFDLTNRKASFESLQAFIRQRVIKLHELRIEDIQKKINLFETYNAIMSKPLKLLDDRMKEFALAVALTPASKDKAKLLADIYLKLGKPPESMFQAFKKSMEIMAFKLMQECIETIKLTKITKKSKKTRNSLMITERLRSYKLTTAEVKELAKYVVEQTYNKSNRWKSNLYMYLGQPDSEKIYKEIRSDIEKKADSMKISYEKLSKQQYFISKPLIHKAVFHLNYLKKGYSIRKTKDFAEIMADYFIRHRHWIEVSKDTMKILMGNPESHIKNEKDISQLKQLTIELQAGLQRINDQRTTMAYIQQDMNPMTYKNIVNEQSKSLEKLKGNMKKFEKILVIYRENCEISAEFIKDANQVYEVKGKILKIIYMKIKENIEFKEFKAKTKIYKPNKLLLVITEKSIEIMQKLAEMIIRDPYTNKFQGIIYKSKWETNPTESPIHSPIHGSPQSSLISKSDDNSPISNLGYNYIEEISRMTLKNLIKVVIDREKDIEEDIRSNLIEFFDEKDDKGEKLQNYQKFFDFLNENYTESLNNEMFEELFPGLMHMKQENLNDFIEYLLKGLRKLDKAIELREYKQIELKIMKNEILEKISLSNQKSNDFIALKVNEFEGNSLVFDGKRKYIYSILYGNGNNRVISKELKGKHIKERFLLAIEKNIAKMDIYIKQENSNTYIENFLIKIDYLEEKHIETLISSINPTTSTLKIKLKLVNLELETMKINMKNLENLFISNKKYLERLYQFKFDIQTLLKQKKQDISNQNNSYNNQEEIIEYSKKTDKKIGLLHIKIAENEEKLELLKAQAKENIEVPSNSNLKAKNIENNTSNGIKNTEKSEENALNREKITANLIEDMTRQLELQKQRCLAMETSQKQTISIKQEITDFFTAANNNALLSQSDLLKLRDYFMYFQKAILKFYIKASLIEADLFELKKDSKKAMIKGGLSMIAGSVPFIGDVLQAAVKVGFELKEKYDESKLMTKCTKFCVLVNSSEILSEVLEEAALILIKTQEKQSIILGLEGFKENFWDKLKKNI